LLAGSFVVLLLAVGMPAWATSPRDARLEVELIDALGRPITDGVVEIHAAGVSGTDISRAAETITLRCNRSGRCSADDIPPNTYSVVVRTGSIVAELGEPIVLGAGTPFYAVIRVTGSGVAAIQSLGTIRITPTGTLSAGSAPSAELDAQAIAERGEPNLASALSQQPGVTLSRPAGGATGLPVGVMLRGDDPKEAIIQLDGNPINNGNTGDFDLSLLDPSAFDTVQIVYGLAPASLVGANTEGGTLNFHTLEPTVVPQGLLRYSFGSFNSDGYTVATTGSAEKVGYAFEARGLYQEGEVNAFPVIDESTGEPATLGSAITGSNALAKLTYALPRDGIIEASVLTFGSNQDLSAPLSSPQNPADQDPGAVFASYQGSERSNVTTFYEANARVPLGHSNSAAPAAFITAGFMISDARQAVTGPAEGYNSYLLDMADVLNNGSLEYERLLPNADLTIVARAQGEQLTVPAGSSGGDEALSAAQRPFASATASASSAGLDSTTQTQTNHTFLARYMWNGGARLEYTAVGYLSTFSTFGTSLNPRAAVVWRPQAQTIIRASLGSGFQAPALADKIVPVPLPPPDPSGLISVGNPNLTADHTFEYELDLEHAFGLSRYALSGELDLYHVDQHGDDIQYIPQGASPSTPMLSYPINIANSMWRGLALQVEAPLRGGLSMQAAYNINQGYPLALPAALAGSAGNLVPGQQFQNVPLHRATFSLQQQRGRFGWTAGVAYESSNNDLNQSAFATVAASVTYRLSHTSIVLAGNNLTDAYAGKFTLTNGGVPYPGLTGPIATDAYQLPAPNLTVTLTQHW